MFVLYYFHEDYDGGECEVIAISDNKEKLEAKREELMAPSRAYAAAYMKHEQEAKKEIRAFCKRQRAALRANRAKTHSLDSEDRTAKLKIFNEFREEEKIADTVRSYYFFSGNVAHQETLYNHHFDKTKLTEPLPVFVAPPNPAKSYEEHGMKIVETEVI